MFKFSITSVVSTVKFSQHVLSILKCSKCNISTNSSKTLHKKFNIGETKKINARSTLYYVTAAGVVVAGLSYAAVPLYRLFCQATSYGGTTAVGHDSSKVEAMSAVKNRQIKVRFNADTASSMRWNFKPQQTDITVSVFTYLRVL